MSNTKRPAAYSAIQRDIGQRIAWAREIVQMDQSEAAGLMSADPSTLNKIEKGTRAPSVFYVIALANRFRVTTDYILRGLLTPAMDSEMMTLLAALHPELVLPRGDMAEDTGRAPVAGKRRRPKIVGPVV